MTDDPKAVLAALTARRARTLAEMQVAGLDILLDESLPPRGSSCTSGGRWEEMQAVLPAVEDEIE